MADGTTDPGDGLVSVKTGLRGVGLIWLTAVAAVGAVIALAYGLTDAPAFLLVGGIGAALAVAAGAASLRTFGYR